LVTLASAVLDLKRVFAIERFGRTLLRPPWELRERVILEHYLIQCLAGEAEVTAGPVAGVLVPGALAFVPAGLVHSVRLRSTRMTMYHCRFTIARSPVSGLTPIVRSRPDYQRALMEAAFAANRQQGAEATIQIRGLIAAVLASLGSETAPQTQGLEARHQASIAATVMARLPALIHPRDLARACGLSHDYFTRQFRITYGCAPRTWLLHERLRHAAEDLLGSEDAVGAVADRWGFASPFTFSRQFAELFSISPARYRRRFR
jgi:AraC-like DNA-binding protein